MVIAYIPMGLIFRFYFHINFDQEQSNVTIMTRWLLKEIISEVMLYSRGTEANVIKCLIKTRFTQMKSTSS